ncbi:ras GTPase-activating protein raskol-like, partial [Pollicipes pollicipes]|uniref:ras GTPase-activating protein raskol-like n=1 Tax=Pollicipes pollicipes TaxID=41117 RepID=UPI0018855D96
MDRRGRRRASWLDFPCRIEGWMNVCDRSVHLGHQGSQKVRRDGLPLLAWEPYFCVLLQDEQTLTAYRSEEMAIGDSLFLDL